MIKQTNFRINILWLFMSFTFLISCAMPKTIELKSPDGKKIFTLFPAVINPEKPGIYFSVKLDSLDVFLPSSLELSSGEIDFSGVYSVKKIETTSVENEWNNNFGEISTVPDKYNQVKIYLKSPKASLNLICRAYNEGIAFAYEIPQQNGISEIGLGEEINFNFNQDYSVWSTQTAQGLYQKIPLSKLKAGCQRPLLVTMSDTLVIALAEAKLVDYSRLSFGPGTDSFFSIKSSLDGRVGAIKQDTITGAFSSESLHGDKVHKKLPFQSPWRVVMIGKNPGELLQNNYILQNLNDPCAIEDISWIKPGKLLREITLTTEGAYAAIDFVAAHNMQYVMFDAGWYGSEMDNNSDATTTTLDPKRSKGPFDLPAITNYAKTKNVGIILYVNRRALEKQLDELLPLYKKWGIAGIKYGFVRVGDQDATAWLHEAVKKTAEHGMIMDVHDEYRPTGFSRTYPNFLTQEGIRGDEETVTNEHTLITMFTRMLAGAADNTICYYNKRVETMGSHASQLAKAVCLFSPLQSVYWYDQPAASPDKLDGLWGDTKHIGNEPELEFFDAVPTTWDETIVLYGEIGKIGVIARRKGNDWFVGGIVGNEGGRMDINYSFLKEGQSYQAKFYTDDETVKTRTKVKISEMNLTKETSMGMNVKPNNGFVIHIVQK